MNETTNYTTPTAPVASKEPSAEKKKVEKVVKGTVKVKKKSGLCKFADVFIAEDVGIVKNYLFSEVVIPTLKRAACDLVTKGVNMIMWGSTGGTKTNNTSVADSVSYRDYSDYSRTNRNAAPAKTYAGYSYNRLVYESFEEADSVLNTMDDILGEYKVVSVADMFEASGLLGEYTDRYYGWSDIRSATIVPTNEGWVINMPKAKPIKSMR